ncbi:hypothetical protein C8Q74DRAFT_768835 [Fomes fomentarius]|nr:hypothetical protein C8Q74DRAFT_768835 [Fomes fomentarius]
MRGRSPHLYLSLFALSSSCPSAMPISTVISSRNLEDLFSQWLPLDKTLGVYLLGTFIGLVLYGISLHQLYRYYRLFPSDPHFIRILVSVVMLLETVHTIMTMHFCYYYLVANYLNFAVLIQGVWSINALPVVLSLTMFTSQLFFATRVFMLGPRYRFVVVVAMLLCLGEIGFSVATAYKAFTVTMIVQLETSASLIATALGLGFVADAMFTVTLAHVVRRSRADMPRYSILEAVQTYIVNTGSLHCIFNLISFIFVLATTHSLIDGLFSIVTARLYANSLLAVLNSRNLPGTKGIEISECGSSYGLHLIARANRRAAAETWNVPPVRIWSLLALCPRFLLFVGERANASCCSHVCVRLLRSIGFGLGRSPGDQHQCDDGAGRLGQGGYEGAGAQAERKPSVVYCVAHTRM